MNSLKKLLAIAGLASLTMLTTQSFLKEEFENIFNGKDFKGWYSFVDGHGKNSDPLKVFRVEPGGIIHVSDSCT